MREGRPLAFQASELALEFQATELAYIIIINITTTTHFIFTSITTDFSFSITVSCIIYLYLIYMDGTHLYQILTTVTDQPKQDQASNVNMCLSEREFLNVF
jgi:hypothetical protein